MATLLRSAFVIARRDFTATVFSQAFLFFLLGPLFPVLMAVIFGSIGGDALSEAERPVVAVVASDAEFRALAGRAPAARRCGRRARRCVELRPCPPGAGRRRPSGSACWHRNRRR